MTPQNKIPFRMSDNLYQCKRNCTGLRKIEPVQNHIKPELQHVLSRKNYKKGKKKTIKPHEIYCQYMQ